MSPPHQPPLPAPETPRAPRPSRARLRELAARYGMTSDEAAEALLIWAAGMEQIGAAAADPEALKAEGLQGLVLLTRTLELGVADVRTALAVYRELLPDLQDCLARMRLMEQTIATLVRALPALRAPGQVAAEAATAPLNRLPMAPPPPPAAAARPASARRKPVAQTPDLFAETAAL
jgi:hypothetical protein